MQRRLKRISNEINELNKSIDILESNGIYFHVDEDNINFIYAMLVGPEKTPYEKGFYFFHFEYPTEYPMKPPKATYCTQGNFAGDSVVRNVRFNPNLYTCGKVCLSMLNTWSGPGWVPANTISNVLVAIQALVLNEMPLQNEPGFELSSKTVLEKYNKIIEYANIKISVFEMIFNPPQKFAVFKPKMNEIFKKNIDFYRNFILSRYETLNKTLVESPAYGMKFILDYDKLLIQIEYTINKISDMEVDEICKQFNDNFIDSKDYSSNQPPKNKKIKIDEKETDKKKTKKTEDTKVTEVTKDTKDSKI